MSKKKIQPLESPYSIRLDELREPAEKLARSEDRSLAFIIKRALREHLTVRGIRVAGKG